MRKKELEGQYRVYLDRFEYRTLLRNAPHPEGALVIRLAGEVGLRISEIVNVRLEHIQRSSVAPDIHFLHVPTEEGEDPDRARGRPRSAFLSNDIHEYMVEYAEANGIQHTEEVIQVSMRTTQEWVKQAAIASAEETGKDDFELVSSLDLRVFFAKQAIEHWRLHPRVLMSIGGWNDLDTLIEDLDTPTETKIVREFDRIESQGWDTWMVEVSPEFGRDVDEP